MNSCFLFLLGDVVFIRVVVCVVCCVLCCVVLCCRCHRVTGHRMRSLFASLQVAFQSQFTVKQDSKQIVITYLNVRTYCVKIVRKDLETSRYVRMYRQLHYCSGATLVSRERALLSIYPQLSSTFDPPLLTTSHVNKNKRTLPSFSAHLQTSIYNIRDLYSKW